MEVVWRGEGGKEARKDGRKKEEKQIKMRKYCRNICINAKLFVSLHP